MRNKKALLSLPLLALSAAASAQSNVTLFGVLDTLVAVGHGSVSNRTQLTHSGNTTTRLGFRGVEDLGSGWSAGFWLEAGVATDTGAGFASNVNNQPAAGPGLGGAQGLTFNRRSTLSLFSPFGELRLGRDYVPTYSNMGAFDSFGNAGVGTSISALLGVTSSTPAGIRASNSIGYILPSGLGGFYGHAMVAFGENAAGATEDDGNYQGFRLGWAQGPINVAFATGKLKQLGNDSRPGNVGISYDFGNAKVAFGYANERLGTVKGEGIQTGVEWRVGSGLVRASYGDYQRKTGLEPKTRKLAVGYVHNLSKRTAVYGTLAHVSNRGGATYSLNGSVTGANASSRGIDLGLRHSF
ncbi:porin [Hydrogenophaga sp.]|jgi:predicted porin|uniref:porin n=1 Tax=Hydrogenophaga sp. TaxID=1904254 RepID=UPI003F6EB852